MWPQTSDVRQRNPTSVLKNPTKNLLFELRYPRKNSLKKLRKTVEHPPVSCRGRLTNVRLIFSFLSGTLWCQIADVPVIALPPFQNRPVIYWTGAGESLLVRSGPGLQPHSTAHDSGFWASSTLNCSLNATFSIVFLFCFGFLFFFNRSYVYVIGKMSKQAISP